MRTRALFCLLASGAPLLSACDKENAAMVYYIVGPIVAGLVVAWITRRYMKGYKQALANVAAKYGGAVTKFGGGAGSDCEIKGTFAERPFVFRAQAEGKGSRISLKVKASLSPAPTLIVLGAKSWWPQAAAASDVDPSYGQPWGAYVYLGDPPDVAQSLLGKPAVQQHLEAIHRSIPLGLHIGPKAVEYLLVFQGQQIMSQPKYYKEEVLSWFIEAMVALTFELER